MQYLNISLSEFIEKYDKEGSIVLLEGKRNVLESDQALLVKLGKVLSEKTSHLKFRSGNADGSDLFFSQGVASVDNSRLQVITPYSGHRQKYNQAYETIALDELQLAAEDKVIYQTKTTKTGKLIDSYVNGNRDRFSIKAAYLIRDTVKAIGTKDIPTATFGIFYDDLENPLSGGTGHTMKVCQQNDIPIIDQQTWMNWL